MIKHRSWIARLVFAFALVAHALPGQAQELSELIENLSSTDQSTRIAAGRAILPLLESQYGEALPGLVDVAANADPAISDGGVALLAMGGSLSEENAEISAAAAPTFVFALTNGSPQASGNAARALGGTLPHTPPIATAALATALSSSPDPAIQTAAARALGRLEAADSDVLAALLVALESDQSAATRGAAAAALGSLGGVTEVSALEAALSDADPFVRQEAAAALAELGGAARSALEALQTVADNEDEDPLIREIAAASVVTIETANTPPDCAAAAAVPDRLWPPNHALVSIEIADVDDLDGDDVSIAVVSVRQDEGADVQGSGNTCPDAVVDEGSASVRAERAGGGDGRVYVLDFQATDTAGATCQGQVQVCVPKMDKGTCSQGAVLVDATTCAP